MKKFACRTCRREVTLDENGVANHLDGSTACILGEGDAMAEYDRHEIVHDESTLANEPEGESSEVGERVSERKDEVQFRRRKVVR